MKIVSEEQLKYIKSEFKDFTDRSYNYVFEGSDMSIFENLVIFYDDILFNKIRSEHYLAMTDCQRIWNKYFWYLRYNSDISKIGGNTGSHIQPISKILEQLYNSGEQVNDLDIEPFAAFATNFEHQKYLIFDYFHPAITDTGVSIYSEELIKIVEILKVKDFNIEELDYYIEQNIDNKRGEIITYRNLDDKDIQISIDTYSASIDQIHPIEILIKCKFTDKNRIDCELVKWWTKFWKKMGPFVAISTINKFDNDKFYRERKRIEK
jgi:hypothetical protein